MRHNLLRACLESLLKSKIVAQIRSKYECTYRSFSLAFRFAPRDSRHALHNRYVRFILLTVLVLASCRGGKSEDAPIHLIGDMDWQQRYQPQGVSHIFKDGRANRPEVNGTLPQGQLHEDEAFFYGKENGNFIAKVPVSLTKRFMEQGKEKFNIFCAPCHDQVGTGHGLVVQRGFPAAADLTGDRVRSMPDGEIFEVISNGIRTMPSHKAQIQPADRWKIISWIRVLERSQRASLQDVPTEMRDRILPEGAFQ